MVWTFDLGKQIEIIKKTIKINQKYGKDDEKTGQQKETITETYIKGSHIQTIQ